MEVLRQDDLRDVRLFLLSHCRCGLMQGRYRLEAMDFSGMREACVEADAESAISNWRDQKGPLRKAGGLVKKLWE
jgi:hypothetical protein